MEGHAASSRHLDMLSPCELPENKLVALLPKGTISSTEARKAWTESGLKNLCPSHKISNTVTLLNTMRNKGK